MGDYHFFWMTHEITQNKYLVVLSPLQIKCCLWKCQLEINYQYNYLIYSKRNTHVEILQKGVAPASKILKKLHEEARSRETSQAEWQQNLSSSPLISDYSFKILWMLRTYLISVLLNLFRHTVVVDLPLWLKSCCMWSEFASLRSTCKKTSCGSQLGRYR